MAKKNPKEARKRVWAKLGWSIPKSDNRSVFPTKFYSIKMCNMSYFFFFSFFFIGAWVHMCIGAL